MYDSEVQCYDILHMNKKHLRIYVRCYQKTYELVKCFNVYLVESVAMFVEMVRQGLTIRVIANRYHHSLDTVKKKFNEVLSSVLKLATYIVKPTRIEFSTASFFLIDNPVYWPYFNNYIGALHDTHIHVHPLFGNVEPFRGRKAEVTMMC